MDANAGAVDHDEVTIVRGRNRLKDAVPHPGLTPAHEAIVAGRRRPIPLRDVAPRRAGAEAPQDAVEHTAIVHPWHAAGLVRQERLDDLPLEIGQLMSAHQILPQTAGESPTHCK